jgi:hypothetical protein
MNRRAFLASVVAAIAGRALLRKPAPACPIAFNRSHTVTFDWVPGDGSLFNPRENVHAQWLQARLNGGLNAQLLRFDRDAFVLADSAFQRGYPVGRAA